MEGRIVADEKKQSEYVETKAVNMKSQLEIFLVFVDIKKLLELSRSQTVPAARQLFFNQLAENLDVYENNSNNPNLFHFDVANNKKHLQILHFLLLEEQYDLINRLLKYQSSKIDIGADLMLRDQSISTMGAYLANKNKPLAILIVQQNIRIQKQEENSREQNRIRAKIISAINSDNVDTLTTFLKAENIKPENVAELFQNPHHLVHTIAMFGAFETFKYFFELKPSLFKSDDNFNYLSMIIEGCKNRPKERTLIFTYLLEENRFSSLDPSLIKDHILGALGVLNPETCDQQDSHGYTPLILAIESGYAISNNITILHILQKKDINAAIQTGDYRRLSLASIMVRTAIYKDSPLLEDLYTLDKNIKIDLFAITSNHVFHNGFHMIYWLPHKAAFSNRPKLLDIFAAQFEMDPNLKININHQGISYCENLALSIAFCAEKNDAAFNILEKFIRQNPVPVNPNATDNFNKSKFVGMSLASYLALRLQYKILQILIEQNPDLIFDLDVYYKFNNNQCGLSFLNSLVNQQQWDLIDTLLKRYEKAKELKAEKIPRINLNRKTNDKNSITIFESLIEEGQYDLAQRLLAFHEGNIKPSILVSSNGVPIPKYIITLLMHDQLTFTSTLSGRQEPIEVNEEVYSRLKRKNQHEIAFDFNSSSYNYVVTITISQKTRSITFKLHKIIQRQIKHYNEAKKTEAAKTLASLSEPQHKKSRRNQKKAEQKAKKKAEQKAQHNNEQKPKAEEPEVYQPDNQQTTSSTETKLDDKDKKEWITCLEHAFADAEQISIKWDDDDKLFIISLPKDEWTVIQHKAKENEVNKIHYQVKDQKFIEDQIIRIIKRHFDENKTAELTFDEQLWQVRVKPNSKKADLTTTKLHHEIATAFEEKIKRDKKDLEKKKKEEERLAKRDRKGKEESKPETKPEDAKNDKGSNTQTTTSTDIKNENKEEIFAEELTPTEIKKLFKAICSYKLPSDMEFSLTKTERKYQTTYSYSGMQFFALSEENNSIDYFNEGVIDSVDYFNALATALNTIIPGFVNVHAQQNNNINNNNGDEVRIVVDFRNYSGKIINDNLGKIKSIFASEIAKKIAPHVSQQNAPYLLSASKSSVTPSTENEPVSVVRQNLNSHLSRLEECEPDKTKNQYEDIHFWNYLLHGLCALTILQGKIRACNEDATEIDKLRNTFRHCCHEIEWHSFYMNIKPVIKQLTKVAKKNTFTPSFFLNSIPTINNELKQFIDAENERYKTRTLGEGCEPLKQDFCLSLIEKFKHEEKDYTLRRNAILMLCSIIGKNQSHGEFHEIYTALHNTERPFEELADKLYEKYFDYDAMHQKNLTFAGG